MGTPTGDLSQIKIPKQLRDELQSLYPNTSPTRIITELTVRVIEGKIDMSFLSTPQQRLKSPTT